LIYELDLDILKVYPVPTGHKWSF